MKRDIPPAHYTLKIKSFSELSEIVRKSGVDKYESSDFEVDGYKWYEQIEEEKRIFSIFLTWPSRFTIGLFIYRGEERK